MIEVFKHDPKAITPTRAYLNDAGIDLYALESVSIPEGHTRVLSTGISIYVPQGYVGKVEDRSSLAMMGLRTGGGVIDPGYTGEIRVVMHNLNFNLHNGSFKIERGQKIAQLLLYKVDTTGIVVVNKLWESDRSDKGFGSSDNNK